MRKRHWDKLMEATGKSFDMDPKTFTLANIFRMELHNFAAQIGCVNIFPKEAFYFNMHEK